MGHVPTLNPSSWPEGRELGGPGQASVPSPGPTQTEIRTQLALARTLYRAVWGVGEGPSGSLVSLLALSQRVIVLSSSQLGRTPARPSPMAQGSPRGQFWAV